MIRCAVLVWLGMVLVTSAQLRVALELPQEKAIPFETVPVEVTVFNDTGRDIPFGTGPGEVRLSFKVRDLYTGRVPDRLETLEAGSGVLPGYASITVTSRLNRLFDLTVAGAFTVEAAATWREADYRSPKRYLDIVAGVELQRVKAVLPDGGERIYTLRGINRNRYHHLLVRIDDEVNQLCYGVRNLGRIVVLKPPMTRVDAEGRLHILFQESPGRFVYSVCLPDGSAIRERSFENQFVTARLDIDDRGEVTVVGAPADTPPDIYRSEIEDQPVRRAVP